MKSLRILLNLSIFLLLLAAGGAAALTKNGQCKVNADCDDGNMCNGTEHCQLGTCKRVKDNPCGEGERCDVKTQSCQLRLCEQNFMCSDGNWCNGQEVCDPARGKGSFSNAYGSGRWGCFPGEPACPGGTCNESKRACEATTRNAGGDCRVPDADGDGRAAIACGGDDCDDSDASVSPGLTEICDSAGIDEDCNPRTMGDLDADGDGHVDMRCCNGEFCGTDCNDRNANINTRSTEVCNKLDDNCDGSVDEGVLLEAYKDNDRDGFGDPAQRQLLCPIGNQLKNFSINDFDCNDKDRSVNPAQGNCP